MPKQDRGAMAAAYELAHLPSHRNRRNEEKAISSGIGIKPVLQVSVNDVLNFPAHKVLLIEVPKERVLGYPEWHIGI
jgi:hypothetical protein